MTRKQTQADQAGWLQGHPEPDYRSLPDAAEARRDGKLGQPIEDGKGKIVAVMGDGSNKRCESLRVEGEVLENNLAEAEAKEARCENEVARVGAPVDSPILTLVFFVLVFFVIHGEARMLEGGIAVLLSSGLTQYGYESGLLVAAIGSVLLKIAIARWRVQGTPTANSKVRVAEYQYEYNLGRLGDQTPTDSEVFTGFLKFASTAAASVLAGGVTGAIAYIVTKSPMPAVVAGSVVALLAGGAMTWFNRGGGSVLAVIALLGASFLNGGCRASGPSDHSWSQVDVCKTSGRIQAEG